MTRRPVPPTHHLKSAIRRIDKIVWKLHDEQLAAYIAYVLAVSKGEKREIRKLFGAKFTAFGDLSVALGRKLTPKERRRAVRLTALTSSKIKLAEDGESFVAVNEAGIEMELAPFFNRFAQDNPHLVLGQVKAGAGSKPSQQYQDHDMFSHKELSKYFGKGSDGAAANALPPDTYRTLRAAAKRIGLVG